MSSAKSNTSNSIQTVVDLFNNNIKNFASGKKLKNLTIEDETVSMSTNPRALSGALKIWGISKDVVDDNAKGRYDVYVPAFGFYVTEGRFIDELCAMPMMKKLAPHIRGAMLTRETYLKDSQVTSQIGTLTLSEGGNHIELEDKSHVEKNSSRSMIENSKTSRSKDHMAEFVRLVTNFSVNCPESPLERSKTKVLTASAPRQNTDLLEMIRRYHANNKNVDISRLTANFKSDKEAQPTFSGLQAKQQNSENGRVISNIPVPGMDGIRISSSRKKNSDGEMEVNEKKRAETIRGMATYLAWEKSLESDIPFTQDLIDSQQKRAAFQIDSAIKAFDESQKDSKSSRTNPVKKTASRPKKSVKKTTSRPSRASKSDDAETETEKETLASPASSPSPPRARTRASSSSPAARAAMTPTANDSDDSDDDVASPSSVSKPRTNTPKTRVARVVSRNR